MNDGEKVCRGKNKETNASGGSSVRQCSPLSWLFLFRCISKRRRRSSAGRIKSIRKENEKEDTTMQRDRERERGGERKREREREKEGGITKEANSSEDRRKKELTTPDLSGKGKRDKADRKGRTT